MTMPHSRPLPLSPGPQLLLDDLLVEDRCRLTRILQHPAKYPGNPILIRDTAWEEDYQQINAVLRDDQLGRYRMWYSAVYRSRLATLRGKESYQAVAYAESDDGYQWRKPTFDLCPVGDHPQTNLLHWGRARPIFNPDSSDPKRRFLAAGLYYHDHPGGVRNDGVNVLHSADGLRWEMDSNWHLLDLHSDTKNHLVYDPRHARWLLYCRPVAINASGRAGKGDYRRRISVMVSEDLREWTYPQTVFYPDERDAPDIDHCQVFHYGSHFLMLYAAMDSPTTGRMHMRLASSPDGLRWTAFPTHEDFIPLGTDGVYDAGIVGAACQPVRQGNKLLIYYNAANLGQAERRTSSQPWVGTGAVSALPADRFVAQHAGDEEGWLLTRQFLLAGKTLRVNMAASANGSVQVEVVKQPPRTGHTDYFLAEHARKGYTYAFDDFGLDDCTSLTGNHVDAPVRWQGRDLSALVGQPVYLRFRVQNADLYSFTVTNE